MAGLLAPILLLSAPIDARAQTENDFQIWVGFFGSAQVFADAPSPVFWLDVHGREAKRGTVVILRPGVGYAFAPWGSIWVGYAWVPVFVHATGERVDEQRIWQQLSFGHRTPSGLVLRFRTRFEQRFSEAGNDVGYRFRQAVRLNYNPSDSVPVGLASWDEVFIGMGSAAWTKKGFDQNRLFVGVAVYAADKIFRVETGYQNVYLVRTNLKRLSHVLAVNLFVTFKGKR